MNHTATVNITTSIYEWATTILCCLSQSPFVPSRGVDIQRRCQFVCFDPANVLHIAFAIAFATYRISFSAKILLPSFTIAQTASIALYPKIESYRAIVMESDEFLPIIVFSWMMQGRGALFGVQLVVLHYLLRDIVQIIQLNVSKKCTVIEWHLIPVD